MINPMLRLADKKTGAIAHAGDLLVEKATGLTFELDSWGRDGIKAGDDAPLRVVGAGARFSVMRHASDFGLTCIEL